MQQSRISGLYALEAFGIPGAAAATMSCRIADGRDMYDNGIVSHFNDSAGKLGIHAGMPVKEAARRMLDRRLDIGDVHRPVEVAHEGPNGRVMAMGSVTFITNKNTGDVICAGSHFGRTSAAYSSRFDLAGVMCSDAGRCKDDSGISGLTVLDQKGVPSAAVSADSAMIGDGMSTYRDGVLSAVNKIADSIGISVGMTAIEAADIMLAHRASGGKPEPAGFVGALSGSWNGTFLDSVPVTWKRRDEPARTLTSGGEAEGLRRKFGEETRKRQRLGSAFRLRADRTAPPMKASDCRLISPVLSASCEPSRSRL